MSARPISLAESIQYCPDSSTFGPKFRRLLKASFLSSGMAGHDLKCNRKSSPTLVGIASKLSGNTTHPGGCSDFGSVLQKTQRIPTWPLHGSFLPEYPDRPSFSCQQKTSTRSLLAKHCNSESQLESSCLVSRTQPSNHGLCFFLLLDLDLLLLVVFPPSSSLSPSDDSVSVSSPEEVEDFFGEAFTGSFTSSSSPSEYIPFSSSLVFFFFFGLTPGFLYRFFFPFPSLASSRGKP
mmetsp:Transcript_2995/g.6619  ORF Transcript_2995/g.6619 Transcript_2995/m.6619 type:complete len:236 (+) Transcript_2995:1380-2087(+)